MDYISWKLTQDLIQWNYKYTNKYKNAKLEGLICLLTFEEYLFKAFEANLTSHTQIGSTPTSYNLSRISDTGNYEVSNCRFITKSDNINERAIRKLTDNECIEISKRLTNHTNTQGEKHGLSKLTSKQVIDIFYDTRHVQDILKDYPVKIDAIIRIQNRISWKSVTDSLPNKKMEK